MLECKLFRGFQSSVTVHLDVDHRWWSMIAVDVLQKLYFLSYNIIVDEYC